MASRTPPTASDRRLAEAGALAVAVFWAANFIVVKAANEQIPPIGFAFLRFGLAAGVLLVALRWREGTLGLPRRDAVAILGLGALGFGAYQILWATALQDIPAGDSALIIAATPVMTSLLAVSSGADVLTRSKLLGSLVAFVGVGVVIAAGPGLGLTASLVGDLLTLGAAACFAIYTAYGAPILRRHSPLRTTAWAMVGGCLVMAVPGGFEIAATTWSTVEPAAWGGLLYSALIPAGISNVIVFHAIRMLGPTRISAYQFLVPFIAVILGAMFLSEPIRIEQIIGGVVIVLGVMLTRA
jgi:drug/metabolite transporter (DMT)-like permease